MASLWHRAGSDRGDDRSFRDLYMEDLVERAIEFINE
jgi:hypothetical protein